MVFWKFGPTLKCVLGLELAVSKYNVELVGSDIDCSAPKDGPKDTVDLN